MDEKGKLLSAACRTHAKNPASCFKVMYGVFMADSSFCTAGAGAKHNNCGNVRPGSGKYGDPNVRWKPVNNWRHYSNLTDGINDNVAIYAQLYEGNGWAHLNIWSNGSKNWLRTVQSYFYK